MILGESDSSLLYCCYPDSGSFGKAFCGVDCGGILCMTVPLLGRGAAVAVRTAKTLR